MTRSRSLISLVGILSLAGLGPALASASDGSDPSLAELRVSVVTPFRLAIRNRAWDGDPHAMPSGSAVLERADGRVIWELADVTSAATSADGRTVALQTGDYQVYTSRLPDTPRRVEGGPYLSPALSNDGKQLVAQRIGESGHILEKVFNTKGIALIQLETGRDRLLLEGNDLYSPSFAADQRVFFGSGGEEGIASLYVLDLPSMSVARLTNRAKDARQTFPSEAPQLVGGAVVYRADDENLRVPEVAPDDFVPVHRFESPQFIAGEGISPNFGAVRIRRPNTQTNQTPPVFQYYDLDKRTGFIEDWYCAKMTYDQHLGTDFKQQAGYDVVAPAAGRVFWRNDGCADTKSKGCGVGFGNFAALLHADGSVSLEAHGKKWTVAERGAWIGCGAKLMESAMSGNANAYHVHHESWMDQTGNVNKSKRYDPFQGACDNNDPSKWATQNGYRSLPAATCQ